MLREYLSTLANKFRSVLGTTEKINAQDFVDKIQDVYGKGHDEGYSKGDFVGWNRGMQEGYDYGLTEGRTEGIEQGKEQGKLELLTNSKYMNANVSGATISVNDVSLVEHTINVNLTSDTITDFSNVVVSQYGKNLLPSDVSNLDNWDSSIISDDVESRRIYKLNLTSNMKYTISFELKDTTGISNIGYLYIYRSNDNWQTSERVTMLTQGTVLRNSYTFTAENGYEYILWWYSIYNRTQVENYYYNFQLELGSSKTAYEPYIEPTTHTANADGTVVNDIKSISPNMTLLTDNNAVFINCNYLRDIDLYIDNLITNVALSGGE